MRYRLMATYRGSPFEAGIGPSDGDIVLFAACPPPEELGFEPATGHWRKQLPINEVQAVWESRPVGSFRGERCMVLDDLGDRLHIGFLGHDGYKAEQLGYWQVDRGVFELVAPRTEVADITEERTEYPRPREAGQPSASLPGYAATGYPAQPAGGTYLPAGQADTASYAWPPEPATGNYPAVSGLPESRFAVSDSTFPAPSSAYSGPDSTFAGLDSTFAGPDSTLPGPDSTFTGPDSTFTGPDSGFPAPDSTLAGEGEVAGPGYGHPDLPLGPGYLPASDTGSGIAMPPPAAEAPLPLEAEAMRAASAARRPRQGAAPAVAASQAAASQSPEPPGLAARASGVGQADVSQADVSQASVGQAGPDRAGADQADADQASADRTGADQAEASQVSADRASLVPGGQHPATQAAAGRATAARTPVPGPPAPAPHLPVPTPLAAAGLAPAPGVPVTAVEAPGPSTRGVAGPAPAGPSSAAPGLPHPSPAGPGAADQPSRQRRSARRRMATELLFADLASQAGIPADRYAVGEEVEGALCLVQTDTGFEVFHSADGARHELQVFDTEEAACFYLFGVLAADAVRAGLLVRGQGAGPGLAVAATTA